jgi:S1-C subfamily serine protease
MRILLSCALLVGCTTAAPSNAYRDYYQTGVSVSDVVHGSPAYLGGVMTGDILLAIDATAIHDRETLRDFVAAHTGRPVHLTGLRAGKPLQLVVTLGRPA